MASGQEIEAASPSVPPTAVHWLVESALARASSAFWSCRLALAWAAAMSLARRNAAECCASATTCCRATSCSASSPSITDWARWWRYPAAGVAAARSTTTVVLSAVEPELPAEPCGVPVRAGTPAAGVVAATA